MANVLLGINNVIDIANFSGSYGSWLSTLPLTNLKKPQLGIVARSTDLLAASTQFAINLTGIYNIRVLALCNHNLSLAATVKVTAYSDAAYSTLVYDSGFVSVWDYAFSTGWGGWNDTTPGGTLPHQYTVNNNRIDTRNYFTWSYAHVMRTTKVEARYWKVEIQDVSNTDGYVQIGRIFIGNAWEPTYNFDFGQSVGWENETTVKYALNGSPYFDNKRPTRAARFTLSHLSQQEAMQTVYSIFGYHGLDKEIFYMQDTDNVYDQHRTNFLCRLRSMTQISNEDFGDRYKAEFDLKESL